MPSFFTKSCRIQFAATAVKRGLLVWIGVLLAMLGWTPESKAWTPSFREFGGVNDSSTNNLLFNRSLSFMRTPIYWDTLASNSNVWNASVLTNWGKTTLGLQAQNVQFLPLLCYTAQWAADHSARSWTNGNTVYRVSPHTYDTNMDYFVYVNGVLNSQSVLTNLTKFPAANVNDWSNYVYQVVSFLHAPPYNVQYFQIWNEAQYTSGFWFGGLSEYYQKVHLPAAQAVRAAGGKVVYGGWPSVSNPTGYLQFLDTNSAWGSIDVLDMHYFNVGDVQTLRSGADSRGYTNLPIWQTEMGFTTDYTYLANYFPKALYWNFANNWTADKYHAFYFANYSANDTSAYGYNHDLWLGSTLNGSGIVLTNLAGVLGGTNRLERFVGVKTSASLIPQIALSSSSMETFSYLTNLVMVVSLSRVDYTNNPTVTLTLPIAPANITGVSRVDLAGTTSNLGSQLTASGSGSQVTVSTRDAAGSSAQTWNSTSPSPTFYVVVNTSISNLDSFSATNLALNHPATASSIQSAGYEATNAVEGNLLTRWSSAFSDPQWLCVDLGATYNINRVILDWEGAYGKSYQIQLSDDAVNWTTIYSTATGSGGVDDLTGLSGSGRYVRMYGIQRGTIYGYSLYEFEVYGTLPPSQPVGLTAAGGNGQVALTWNAATNAASYNVKRAATAGGPYATLATVTATNYVDTTGTAGVVYYYVVSAVAGQTESLNSSTVAAAFLRNLAGGQSAYASSIYSSSYPATNAVDGDFSTQWLSVSSDPQWIYVDLGTNYLVDGVTLNWGTSAAKSYQLNVSTNAINWVTVFSTNSGAGGNETIGFTPTTARYVRVYGIQRLTTSGYALNEFQVFGMAQPFTLAVSPVGNALRLSWPADGNFALWTATNLSPPIVWFPVTNLIQGTNLLNVTVTPMGPFQFFQLRNQ